MENVNPSRPYVHAASPLCVPGRQFLFAPRAVPAAPFPGLLPGGMTADAGARTLAENGRCLGPRGQAPLHVWGYVRIQIAHLCVINSVS